MFQERETMNTRVYTSQQNIWKHRFNRDGVYKVDCQGAELRGSDKAGMTAKQATMEKKLALLQDVNRLKKKLKDEENIHRALQRALTQPLGSLPRLPPYLPPNMLELVAEIAVLEEEVVRLEEQVLTCRLNLHQDSVLCYSKPKLESPIKKSERILSIATAAEQWHSQTGSVSVTRVASTTSDISPDRSTLSQGRTTSTSSDITTTSDQLGQSSSDSSSHSKSKSNQTHCKSTRNKIDAVYRSIGQSSSSFINPKAGLNDPSCSIDSSGDGKGQRADQVKIVLHLHRNVQLKPRRLKTLIQNLFLLSNM